MDVQNQHFILICQIKSSHFNLQPRIGSIAETWKSNTSHVASGLHVCAEAIQHSTAPAAWQMSIKKDWGQRDQSEPGLKIWAVSGRTGDPCLRQHSWDGFHCDPLSSFYWQSASLWSRKHDGMTETFQLASVFPSGWSEMFVNLDLKIRPFSVWMKQPPPLRPWFIVFSPSHGYNFKMHNHKFMLITFILQLFAGCQWETEIRIFKHAWLFQPKIKL